MDGKKIHIGRLVQTFVRENHINSAELARKVGKTKQNIYDFYKRDDVEVKLLLAISEALHHNFFEDIYPPKKLECDIDLVFDTLKEMVVDRMSKL
jgi:hypothetical protein